MSPRSSHFLRRSALLAAAALAIPLTACKPGTSTSLKAARAGFTTHLTRQDKESIPPEPPPAGVFDLVKYDSPAGSLSAYVTPDPKDGKKHPIIIWLVGGFSNSIGSEVWEPQEYDNDQSASAYRQAGLGMLFPSLRGGNDNPGSKEGFYGEVDDVLAATAYAAGLPWVDPQRIYLGGHSTGGTLALLVGEAADPGTYRAVISFGAADSVAGYGSEVLPFDASDRKEVRLRAPMLYLGSINSPTVIIEGDQHPSNLPSLESMQKISSNPKLSFVTANGFSHFSVLSPANAVLAEKLAHDEGPDGSLSITPAEIAAAKAKAKTGE